MSPLGDPAAPPPPDGGGRSLPERMKANKALAGTVCPGCRGAISLGQDVHNCPACGTSQHASCRESAGTCCSPDCSHGEEVDAPSGAPTKACSYCGEQILKSAKKCKHCKEILSPALRKARERAGKGGDANLGRDSLIYGLVGLIICQIVLGPIAIIKGTKALKQGTQTTMAGFGIAMGIIDLLFFIIYILMQV